MAKKIIRDDVIGSVAVDGRAAFVALWAKLNEPGYRAVGHSLRDPAAWKGPSYRPDYGRSYKGEPKVS